MIGQCYEYRETLMVFKALTMPSSGVSDIQLRALCLHRQWASPHSLVRIPGTTSLWNRLVWPWQDFLKETFSARTDRIDEMGRWCVMRHVKSPGQSDGHAFTVELLITVHFSPPSLAQVLRFSDRRFSELSTALQRKMLGSLDQR